MDPYLHRGLRKRAVELAFKVPDEAHCRVEIAPSFLVFAHCGEGAPFPEPTVFRVNCMELCKRTARCFIRVYFSSKLVNFYPVDLASCVRKSELKLTSKAFQSCNTSSFYHFWYVIRMPSIFQSSKTGFLEDCLRQRLFGTASGHQTPVTKVEITFLRPTFLKLTCSLVPSAARTWP